MGIRSRIKQLFKRHRKDMGAIADSVNKTGRLDTSEAGALKRLQTHTASATTLTRTINTGMATVANAVVQLVKMEQQARRLQAASTESVRRARRVASTLKAHAGAVMLGPKLSLGPMSRVNQIRREDAVLWRTEQSNIINALAHEAAQIAAEKESERLNLSVLVGQAKAQRNAAQRLVNTFRSIGTEAEHAINIVKKILEELAAEKKTAAEANRAAAASARVTRTGVG